MNLYKISIIIPVYNVREYIDKTLESIYNQSFKEFEIILIDDGSTDGTYEILQRYEKENKNIKLVKQENSGPSVARNKGLKIAEGEYIVFVDSDDLLPVDSLEYRYKIAKEKDVQVAVFGTAKTTDGINVNPIARHMFKAGYRTLGKDSDILWALGPCNKIFEREVLEDLYFPENINYAEDQVFIMNSFFKSKKIYADSHNVYYYRMRGNGGDSLTQQVKTKSKDILIQVQKVWNRVIKSIDENIMDKKQANAIKIDYFYRLMIIDIWPLLNGIEKNNTEDVKRESLGIVKAMMNNIGNSSENKAKAYKNKPFEKIIKANDGTLGEKLAKLNKYIFLYKVLGKAKSTLKL